MNKCTTADDDKLAACVPSLFPLSFNLVFFDACQLRERKHSLTLSKALIILQSRGKGETRRHSIDFFFAALCTIFFFAFFFSTSSLLFSPKKKPKRHSPHHTAARSRSSVDRPGSPLSTAAEELVLQQHQQEQQQLAWGESPLLQLPLPPLLPPLPPLPLLPLLPPPRPLISATGAPSSRPRPLSPCRRRSSLLLPSSSPES